MKKVQSYLCLKTPMWNAHQVKNIEEIHKCLDYPYCDKLLYSQYYNALYFKSRVEGKDNTQIIKAQPYVEQYLGTIYCVTVYSISSVVDDIEQTKLVPATELSKILDTICLMKYVTLDTICPKNLANYRLLFAKYSTDFLIEQGNCSESIAAYFYGDSTLTCCYNDHRGIYLAIEPILINSQTTDFVVHTEFKITSKVSSWSANLDGISCSDLDGFLMNNLKTLLKFFTMPNSHLMGKQVYDLYNTRVLVTNDNFSISLYRRLLKDPDLIIYNKVFKAFLYLCKGCKHYHLVTVEAFKQKSPYYDVSYRHAVIDVDVIPTSLDGLRWNILSSRSAFKILTSAFINRITEEFE